MLKLVHSRPVFRLSPGMELFLTLIVVFLSFITLMILGMLLAIPLFDVNFLSMTGENLVFSMENIQLLKYLQIVQSIALFVVPPFLIAWLLSVNTLQYLDLRSYPNQRLILYTVFAMLAAIPVINFFAEVNSWLSLPDGFKGIEEWMRQKEDEAMELTRRFLHADSAKTLALNIFMIGFLPAIGEELLFRGILQKQFTRWFKNHHAGIIVSALLFSAMHLQFYGFLPCTLLGLLFGYMLIWTGSLWIPILGHFVNNTTIVIITYFTGKDVLDPSVENVGAPESGLIYFFLGLTIFIPVLWMFYRESRERKINASPLDYESKD